MNHFRRMVSLAAGTIIATTTLALAPTANAEITELDGRELTSGIPISVAWHQENSREISPRWDFNTPGISMPGDPAMGQDLICSGTMRQVGEYSMEITISRCSGGLHARIRHNWARLPHGEGTAVGNWATTGGITGANRPPGSFFMSASLEPLIFH